MRHLPARTCFFLFQERHSRDVTATPGSSQRLLRLLQEAAVLRYKSRSHRLLPAESPAWHPNWCRLHILYRICHRHPRWLWKDLSACGCSRRVSIPAYCVLFFFPCSCIFLCALKLYVFEFGALGAICSLLSVLIIVFSNRNLECLNLLLNTGADFNRKDNFGR